MNHALSLKNSESIAKLEDIINYSFYHSYF